MKERPVDAEVRGRKTQGNRRNEGKQISREGLAFFVSSDRLQKAGLLDTWGSTDLFSPFLSKDMKTDVWGENLGMDNMGDKTRVLLKISESKLCERFIE